VSLAFGRLAPSIRLGRATGQLADLNDFIGFDVLSDPFFGARFGDYDISVPKLPSP
jgi:hypothetical protein